jgi:bacillolysin
VRRSLGSTAAVALVLCAGMLVVRAAPAGRAQDRRVAHVEASGPVEVRQANSRVAAMLREGTLEVADATGDTMLPWHSHERLRQVYQGVPVFGGDLRREFADGVVVGVVGQTYEGIDLDPTPALTAFDVRSMVERLSGEELGESRTPQLVVLAAPDGRYVLAYDVQVATPEDVRRYFIDARTGEVAWQYSNLQTQTAAVGKGTGVLGDPKKVMSAFFNGTYYTNDKMRPPAIYTYDMKSNIQRMLDVLNGRVTLSPGWSDMGAVSNNVWTDGATVDAQVYAGYTYDYFYKRMGRKGLNDKDMSMRMFVHPIDRNAVGSLYTQYSLYYTNAFYAGGGYMVFGEGLPSTWSDSRGRKWNYTSAALDIVAHELSHGVTDYTSDLIYMYESGALNEAFSDIMATAIEFYFQTAAADVRNGSGVLKADYLEGEDVVTAGGSAFGLRSMANPARDGNPDHYSKRFLGDSDNGYVHANSTIASHAFFLAIEGGTNATSGRTVQGVGGSNREQIEKIFYRAWVYKLPSNATYSTARSATIVAARELYGRGSTAETAIIQAWDAVGVDVGSVPALGAGDTDRRLPAATPRMGLASPRIR